MGSDGTSKFVVKDPRTRKRTKRRDKSREFTNKPIDINPTEDNGDEVKGADKQNAAHKKRKHRKQKSNGSFDNSQEEALKNDEQENNYTSAQKDLDDEESNDEATPPKRLQKANIMNTGNGLKDTEESRKSDAKKPKQPSKRQVKRERAEKKENEKKEAGRLEAMKKGLSYVSKWKHAQSEWKFEKLRQIWLMDNLLDETSIPDDIFPTVLEYFEGCKGMAREQLLKKGMGVIKKVEEDEENKDETESVAYQRARRLLQALPTET